MKRSRNGEQVDGGHSMVTRLKSFNIRRRSFQLLSQDVLVRIMGYVSITVAGKREDTMVVRAVISGVAYRALDTELPISYISLVTKQPSMAASPMPKVELSVSGYSVCCATITPPSLGRINKKFGEAYLELTTERTHNVTTKTEGFIFYWPPLAWPTNNGSWSFFGEICDWESKPLLKSVGRLRLAHHMEDINLTEMGVPVRRGGEYMHCVEEDGMISLVSSYMDLRENGN